jgi:hypothetical protein
VRPRRARDTSSAEKPYAWARQIGWPADALPAPAFQKHNQNKRFFLKKQQKLVLPRSGLAGWAAGARVNVTAAWYDSCAALGVAAKSVA